MNPLLTVLLVLIIGIVVGILFQQMKRPGWLSRQMAGGRRGDVTSALVGIAGAFIGFHLAALFAAGGGTIVLLVAAAIGAVLVVWGWRELRL
jgi:uncharacterized membrane protein YeaQ/YmgE (transglycosylase-associated protein family)